MVPNGVVRDELGAATWVAVAVGTEVYVAVGVDVGDEVGVDVGVAVGVRVCVGTAVQVDVQVAVGWYAARTALGVCQAMRVNTAQAPSTISARAHTSTTSNQEEVPPLVRWDSVAGEGDAFSRFWAHSMPASAVGLPGETLSTRYR